MSILTNNKRRLKLSSGDHSELRPWQYIKFKIIGAESVIRYIYRVFFVEQCYQLKLIYVKSDYESHYVCTACHRKLMEQLVITYGSNHLRALWARLNSEIHRKKVLQPFCERLYVYKYKILYFYFKTKGIGMEYRE